MPKLLTLSAFSFSISLILSGCSSDPEEENEEEDVAIDVSRTDTNVEDSDVEDTSDDTDPIEDTDLPDGLFCLDDDDGDGHYAEACGGDDCNDNEPREFGGASEICDLLDNDCNGEVNDGLSCVFYAHTGDALYTINPIASPPVATRIASTPDPALWDIDTHPDGTLYGVSSEALFRFNTSTNHFDQVAPLTGYEGDANGMAIDNNGMAFITSGDALYTIDLETGVMSLVGHGEYESAGDCVVDKGGVLYLSSRHGEDGYSNNSLVFLNGQTGEGSVIGSIGIGSVYALTSAWSTLYGLTSDGELIRIDTNTGHGELLHTFGEDFRWYGAASSPERQ